MAALLRGILVTAIAAGVVLFIFLRLSIDQRQKALEEIEALNQELEQRIAQREAMLDRLSRSRRLAHIEVIDQAIGAAGEPLETTIEFIELNEDGREIARQRITVPGATIYVDAWTVKFDHHQVAEGHPMHGRTLVLLRRIFSDSLAPRDGIELDTPGAIPPGYTASDVSRYEQGLWEQFWQIATDSTIARAMGVRVAQGEAVYKPVEKGDQYELIVDAAGGISLMPLDRAAPSALGSAGHE